MFSQYKCLYVVDDLNGVTTHLGFSSGNFFLIALFIFVLHNLLVFQRLTRSKHKFNCFFTLY